jgi:hypothetical protein
LPEAWARGAVVERTTAGLGADTLVPQRALFTVPEAPGTVTLAALQDLNPRSAVRGPDETFQSLFARPFGPLSLATYVKARATKPPPVFGISHEDTKRMQLVLDQLAYSERGRRLSEGLGGTGFGLLMVGAGVGVLHVDPDASSGDKTEARILGGSLLGLGALFTVGGVGSMFSSTTGEKAALEFHQVVDSGGDPALAYAAADKRLQELIDARRAERIAGGFFGALFFLGSATGFVWSELAADENDSRFGPRLGWGAGALGGILMFGDAVLTETPIDSLTNIWREDPSINQYRPRLSLSTDGAFFSLSGEL